MDMSSLVNLLLLVPCLLNLRRKYLILKKKFFFTNNLQLSIISLSSFQFLVALFQCLFSKCPSLKYCLLLYQHLLDNILRNWQYIADFALLMQIYNTMLCKLYELRITIYLSHKMKNKMEMRIIFITLKNLCRC